MIKQTTTKTGLFAPLATLVALVVGMAGCDCSGPKEIGTIVACDRHTGDLSLSSPTFALPPTLAVLSGGSCLDRDGTCGHNGSVRFDASSTDVEGNAIVLSIMATPTAGPGTYALLDESADVFTQATIYWSGENRLVMNSDLIVRSGTLVLTRNDVEHFSGTFTMELETPDGRHHLSLTGGTFDAGGCSFRTEEVCISSDT